MGDGGGVDARQERRQTRVGLLQEVGEVVGWWGLDATSRRVGQTRQRRARNLWEMVSLLRVTTCPDADIPCALRWHWLGGRRVACTGTWKRCSQPVFDVNTLPVAQRAPTHPRDEGRDLLGGPVVSRSLRRKRVAHRVVFFEAVAHEGLPTPSPLLGLAGGRVRLRTFARPFVGPSRARKDAVNGSAAGNEVLASPCSPVPLSRVRAERFQALAQGGRVTGHRQPVLTAPLLQRGLRLSRPEKGEV